MTRGLFAYLNEPVSVIICNHVCVCFSLRLDHAEPTKWLCQGVADLCV